MHECRLLWERYRRAVIRSRMAPEPDIAAAWWGEAQEWLRRYFDAVEQMLQREGLQ